MNRKIIALFWMFLAVTTASFAEEQDMEIYESDQASCERWAKEDKTPSHDMAEYMATCLQNFKEESPAASELEAEDQPEGDQEPLEAEDQPKENQELLKVPGQ